MKPRPFPRPRPPPWYLSPPRLLSAQIFPGESSVQSGLSEPPALGPCRVLPVWNPIQKTEDRTLGKSVSFVCLLLHLSRDRGPPPTQPTPVLPHTHTHSTLLSICGVIKKRRRLWELQAPQSCLHLKRVKSYLASPLKGPPALTRQTTCYSLTIPRFLQKSAHHPQETPTNSQNSPASSPMSLIVSPTALREFPGSPSYCHTLCPQKGHF